MKFSTRVLLLVILTASARSQTYQPPPPFKHVVIIVQENRTPDNLFGSSPSLATCGMEDPFEIGVDITNGGYNAAAGKDICLTSLPLPNGGGDHTHTGWVHQYNGGDLGGANAAQYTYVPKAQVQPYFDMATNYGFANYMFMTHQGPSFEAHQFLFGGTSAPVYPGDSNGYYQDFAAENAVHFWDSGCPVGGQTPKWITPQGGDNEIIDPDSSECYDHNTLVTYQDSNNVVHDRFAGWNKPYPSWRYYTPTRGIIWDAAEANPQTCYTQTGPPPGTPPTGTPCAGTEWGHVILPLINPYQNSSAPILTDIQNCQLPAVSWVIPDEAWSDHPNLDKNHPDLGLGPDWVAAIVNSIGTSTCMDNGQSYWKDTVVFVIWDDWGGFYDHVPPPAIYTGQWDSGLQRYVCTNQNAPNGWGCGYVYGFRVPLLVVSAYTPSGYVSGALPSPGEQPAYEHDFGSILRFTENNFGLPFIDQSGKNGYADQNGLDGKVNNQPVVPLWDFFLGSVRSFTPIQPTDPTHNSTFFINFYQSTVPGQTQPLPPDGPESGDPDD